MHTLKNYFGVIEEQKKTILSPNARLFEHFCESMCTLRSPFHLLYSGGCSLPGGHAIRPREVNHRGAFVQLDQV